MNTLSPPKKPDTIYYSPAMGLASTNCREGDIAYVPADECKRLQELNDNLRAAMLEAQSGQYSRGDANRILRSALPNLSDREIK